MLELIADFQADLPPEGAPPGASGPAATPQRQHQPWLAVLLSFLWPGIGQIYNTQQVKGIVMICVNLALGVLTYVSCGLGSIIWMPFWIVAWIDALLIGNKVEAGRAVGEWEFF